MRSPSKIVNAAFGEADVVVDGSRVTVRALGSTIHARTVRTPSEGGSHESTAISPLGASATEW